MIFGFNTDVKVGNTVYHVQSEARKKERLLQTQIFVKGHCIGKHATSYADKMSQPGFSDEQMHGLLKEQHKHIVELVRQGHVEAAIDAAIAKARQAAAEPSARPPAEPIAAAERDAGAPAAAVAGPLESPAQPLAPVTETPAAIPAAMTEAAAFADAPAVEIVADAPPGVETPPAAPLTSAETVTPAHRTMVLPPLETASLISPPAQGSAIRVEAVGIPAEKGLKLEWIPTEALFMDGTLVLKLQVLTEEGQPVPEAQLTSRVSVGETPPAYLYATTDSGGNAELRTVIGSAELPECSILVQASFRGRSASRRLRVRLHG